MKKFKKRFIISTLLLLFFVFTVTPASAFLVNWGFDPDGGADSIVEIPQYFNLDGTAHITNDLNALTFQEDGTFISTTYGPPSAVWSPFGNLTASFTGSGTLTSTAFLFNAVPSSLVIYDAANNAIGTFNLLSGGGLLDSSFGPAQNGLITANFVAESLAPGYWFTDKLGTTDLSDLTLTNNSPILTLGFATTNATLIEGDPNFPISTDGNGHLTDFYVGNNGQFRLDVVPEPGTLLLFGVGLLGFAAVARKKFFKA